MHLFFLSGLGPVVMVLWLHGNWQGVVGIGGIGVMSLCGGEGLSVGCGLPASRGLPGGNSLFFCVAKRKVSKRKGDPMVWVPPLRCGQPAVLAENGAGLELASLRQSP
ncbi:MAG: hypothetical protein V4706_02245, partial [Pseudomonadota bacterium]